MSKKRSKRTLPTKLALGEHRFRLQRFGPDDRSQMYEFAQTLNEYDQLFLRRDITQQVVIDRWIEQEDSDERFTIVAYDNDVIAGYGSLDREPLSWTRHLGEIRIIVGEDYRSAGLGGKLGKEILDVSRDLGLNKVIARMTLRQEGARRMFETLGFQAEALLADWVIDRSGKTHDLVIMSNDVTGLTS